MSESNATDSRDTQERLAQLEDQVRRLQDREDVIEALRRYPRGLDRHDSEILASAFHPDAHLRYGPDTFSDGPTKFVPWANAFHEETWNGHTHVMEVNSVEIDGDTAHTMSYVFFSLRRKDEDIVDLGCGRYIDRLERRDGVWRIAAREMLLEWRGTLVSEPKATDHTGGTWDNTDPFYQRPLEVEF